MGDTEEEIIEALKDTFQMPTLYGKYTYTLTFKYNDREYEFIFTMGNTKYSIHIINDCIKITGKQGGELDSAISANSEQKKCFNPILKTNSRNKPEPRTKNIDVLQVLKSKLALCLPNKKNKVMLYDAARSDYVRLSPFSIMRGGDGVYEKYGYKSEEVEELKKKIPRLTFDDLSHSMQKLVEKAYNEYLPGELLPQHGLIIDILQKIPFEVENKLGVSEEIFYWMIEDASMEQDEVLTYFLDTESKEWKEWNKKLIFTDLDVEMPPVPRASTTILALPKAIPLAEVINNLKKEIELAEKEIGKSNNESVKIKIIILGNRIKELEAQLEAQRGGKRSDEKPSRRQTKKNRRRK